MIDVVVVVPQWGGATENKSFFCVGFFENRFKLLFPRVRLTAAASVCSPSGAFQPSAHFQAQCAALSVTRSLTHTLLLSNPIPTPSHSAHRNTPRATKVTVSVNFHICTAGSPVEAQMCSRRRTTTRRRTRKRKGRTRWEEDWRRSRKENPLSENLRLVPTIPNHPPWQTDSQSHGSIWMRQHVQDDRQSSDWASQRSQKAALTVRQTAGPLGFWEPHNHLQDLGGNNQRRRKTQVAFFFLNSLTEVEQSKKVQYPARRKHHLMFLI